MKKKSNQGLDLSLSCGETITGHAKAFHIIFEKSLKNVLPHNWLTSVTSNLNFPATETRDCGDTETTITFCPSDFPS